MKKEELIIYLKQGSAAACVLGFIWGVFFAQVGPKSFSGHMVDVWQSPTMQQKLSLFHQSFLGLFDKPVRMVEDAKARVAHSLVKDQAHSDISRTDRESLDRLIDDAVD